MVLSIVAVVASEVSDAMAGSASEVAVAASDSARNARRSVTLEWQLVVRGGASSTPFVVDTMSAASTTGETRFARTSKTEIWIQKCAVGRSGKRGDLKRCHVFDYLRNRMNAIMSSEVADDSQETASADPDLMDALDDIGDGDGPTPKKKRV